MLVACGGSSESAKKGKEKKKPEKEETSSDDDNPLLAPLNSVGAVGWSLIVIPPTATTMSTPFIEIPQRLEASPSITTKPLCPEAAAHSDALPLTRTRPDMMFSATLQPTFP